MCIVEKIVTNDAYDRAIFCDFLPPVFNIYVNYNYVLTDLATNVVKMYTQKITLTSKLGLITFLATFW